MLDAASTVDDGPRADPLLGVVLVNYRCAALIGKQLASGALEGFRVVLVDNASDPAEIQALSRQYGVAVVLLDHNAGFAGGVNAAVASGALARCDAYLLLNPDVEIRRVEIDLLLSILRSRKCAAVAPVVVDEFGRPWVSAAGGPATLRSVFWYFAGISHLLPRLSGFFWTRRQVRSGERLQPCWLCGAVLMISAEAWTRYGPLPEDELVYAEDVAWGVRCTANGGRLELVRSVEVLHAGGASGASDRWVGATARFFRRELGPWRGGVAAMIMRLGLAARRLLRRVSRRFAS